MYMYVVLMAIGVCEIPGDVVLHNRHFHKLDEIGNNASIGIIGFTTWKQNNPMTKCYPQWG